MVKIAVIGGGAGGTCAALELAKNKFDITLFEAGDNILNRTSARTPGRLGLGFHYPGDESLETARTIIRAAIEFKKTFPRAIMADHRGDQSYLGKGWYFITKNSQQPADEFLKYCEKAREMYTEESEKDGCFYYDTPENFFRVLELNEYKNLIDSNNTVLGIETNEGIFNWNIVAKEIIDKLAQSKNIKILTHHRVCDIQSQNNQFELLVEIQKKSSIQMTFDIVINAACEYRVILDSLLGYKPKTPWVNRLKLLAKIQLPSEMVSKHSMFFARGPFAMFTNIGDGTGFTTYAPVTNCNAMDASEPFPLSWEKMITQGIDSQREKEIGEAIIDGVSIYIPNMRNAKLLKIFAGIVHHHGTANIYDATSDMHQRQHTGIYNFLPNYYSLDTGKLCLAPYYGRILTDMILAMA